MHIRNSVLAASALALAVPVAANAQSTTGSRGFLGGYFPSGATTAVTGLYIAGGGGANWAEQAELSGGAFTGVAPFASNRGRVNFQTGWVALGSIGYGFGNGLRVEVEGNFRQNEVDRLKGFGSQAGFSRNGGFQRTYGVMGNVFYDFNIPGVPWVTPYIGGGAGYAWTEWRNVRGVGNGTGIAFGSSGTEGNFAHQAIGGVAANILAVPGLAATLEYRYFATMDNTFGARTVAPTGAQSGARLEATNQNHAVLVGLRYAFNQPRPAQRVVAPAPAPAPAPARTYLVFFDWDRADLTDRARQIIADAAQNSRSVRATRIEVAGHADRSGSDAYNLRLSQRRADAVAAELVRQGVNRGEITIQAFGESRPLVPTADGVREPQNRRVEIVLR
jgi:outer membrane protein OmpA-like peptidoglycan-associated protein